MSDFNQKLLPKRGAGQAHLPDHEAFDNAPLALIERLSRCNLPSDVERLWVGKVGLPRLFRSAIAH